MIFERTCKYFIPGEDECLAQALTALHGHEQGSDEYVKACRTVLKQMTPAERDTLKKLVRTGPVQDSDVPSKSGRDALIAAGLAVRVCAHGMQGFTAANYIGWDVVKSEVKK